MLWRYVALVALLGVAACSRESEPVVLTIPPTPTTPEAFAEPTTESTITSTSTSTATVESRPTDTSTPTVTRVPPTATASPTPSPTSTPTATSPPPTPTVPAGSVVVTEIIFDPAEGRDGDGETVYITNQGETPVDLTGWTLSDLAEHTYTFPAFVLEPGMTVAVQICDGEDSDEILYWGRCSAVWNNDGDTAFLRDATGREISTYSY